MQLFAEGSRSQSATGSRTNVGNSSSRTKKEGSKESVQVAQNFLETKSPKDGRSLRSATRKIMLANGWRIGETAYYNGASEVFSPTEKLNFGQAGTVTGPCEDGDSDDDEYLSIRFPGNAKCIAVPIDELCKAPVPTTLPGGFKLGEEVYYSGPPMEFKDGDRLNWAAKGTVTGPCTAGDKDDDKYVSVLFQKNKNNVFTKIAALVREPPPPSALPLPEQESLPVPSRSRLNLNSQGGHSEVNAARISSRHKDKDKVEPRRRQTRELHRTRSDPFLNCGGGVFSWDLGACGRRV